MAVFKCKMCGGALNIEEGKTIIECDFCGSKQSVPKLDDERRANLYDRANHFRRNNDYDKALSIYETILNEEKTDAEAYWSILLCKYGVEYVEDPVTHKRVPTINRTQYTSIFADEDYKSAIQNADTYQSEIYEEEAKKIDEIQKGILAISEKEDPFDVFICYKETDKTGRRTKDSVLAQELYFGLKNEGLKVFFSRITLEDKLGTEYEPYIFAALNSAKVMVVLGTQPEFFNSVWVKNEWSRYLSLIKHGDKKTLIPAYKDMDPYDLPEDFSHLQAQDMNKLGFMQDVIYGIKKIIGSVRKQIVDINGEIGKLSTITLSKTEEESSKDKRIDSTEALIRRAYLFCEDGEIKKANEYAEKVLDINPECAEAYIIKFMVKHKLDKLENCVNNKNFIGDDANYLKAIRFAVGEQKQKLINYKNEQIYINTSLILANLAQNFVLYDVKQALKGLNDIRGYKDVDKKIEEVKERIYDHACNKLKVDNQKVARDIVDNLDKAIEYFECIEGYKDVDDRLQELIKKRECIQKELEKKESRIITIGMILLGCACMVVVLIGVIFGN